MKVELNKSEWNFAQIIGNQRTNKAKDLNMKHKVEPKAGAMDTNVLGYAGEIAAAKYLNVFLDLNHMGETPVTDLVWNGRNVDVKTAKESNYGLGVHESCKEKTELETFILVTGNPPLMNVVGHATREQVFQDKYFKPDGNYYLVPQKDLVKFT